MQLLWFLVLLLVPLCSSDQCIGKPAPANASTRPLELRPGYVKPDKGCAKKLILRGTTSSLKVNDFYGLYYYHSMKNGRAAYELSTPTKNYYLQYTAEGGGKWFVDISLDMPSDVVGYIYKLGDNPCPYQGAGDWKEYYGTKTDADITIAETANFKQALLLSDDASSLVTNIGKDAFNAAFKKCPVVRGLRAVYVRSTPVPSSFNAFDVFTNYWSSANNRLNVDFKLYNSIADARSSSNAWDYCNYDTTKAGFPLDCGPKGHVGGHRFFTMPGTTWSKGVGAATANNGLEIYTGDDCPDEIQCQMKGTKGKDYRGQVSVTKSGRTCQAWNKMTPQKHNLYTEENKNTGGLGEHNYCRNPDGEPGVWCYTTDPDKRFELCNVQVCEGVAPAVKPAVETPAEQTPAEQTAAIETPAEQTAAVETPAEEEGSGETPAEQTAAVETPAEQSAAVETPAEEEGSGETAAVETPAEQTAESRSLNLEPILDSDSDNWFF